MMNWAQVIMFVSMLVLAAMIMQVNSCGPELCGKDYHTERTAEKVIDDLADALNEKW